MSHERLDDIRSKFARACAQEAEARSVVKAWLKTHPYGVSGERDPNGWFVIRFHPRELPPRQAANAVADYLHNLRVCLDHVICALVEKNNAVCGVETGFPVVADRANWQSAVGSRLRGFPKEWRGLVEDAQPFQYGQRASQHPLHMLHHMDIRHKHRLLVPIVVRGIAWTPELRFNRPMVEGERVVQRKREHVVFADGAEIAAFRCVSERNDLHVIDFGGFDSQAQVAHGWGTEITNTGKGGFTPLPNFQLFVGSVVESIAPAFR